MGGTNSSLYTGEIEYHNMPSTINSYWMIPLRRTYISLGAHVEPCSPSPCDAWFALVLICLGEQRLPSMEDSQSRLLTLVSHLWLLLILVPL